MCFYQPDCDWYASVHEETTVAAAKPTRCRECDVMVPIGGIVHHIYLQEAEECKECQNGYCECEGECCKCPEPSYGEEFDYDRCDDCHKFLEAVATAEKEAGCGPHESRPMLEQMIEDIQGGGSDEADKYFLVAERDYPELESSGYLRGIRDRMFPVDDELHD